MDCRYVGEKEKMNRKTVLALILLMVASAVGVFAVKPVFAQASSAPTFSVSTTSSLYVVPTTYSTNQFTGANVTNTGYTVSEFNITFTIQNQPSVTAFNFEYKGHYSSKWSTPLFINDYNVSAFASSGAQTTVTIWGNNDTGPFGQSPANETSLYLGSDWGITVPFGSQIDFRLQAVSGTGEENGLGGWSVIGSVSDWSTAQTVTVSSGSPTVAPSVAASPTPTSSTPATTVATPELPALAILPLLLSSLSLALMLKRRRTSE